MGRTLITLDPGHGPRGNPYPPRPGHFEGTQMWRLAQFMAAELESRGIGVAVTRPRLEDNPTLAARGGMAARNGSGMFYSLHSNAAASASDTRARGSEVFLSVRGGRHRGLAEALVASSAGVMGHANRGVKTRPSAGDPGRDGLGVLHAAASGGVACAMLAEFGFHTNPLDAAFLTDDASLRRLAASQAGVVAGHFNIKGKGDPDMVRYEELAAGLDELRGAVDEISLAVMPRYGRLADTPDWMREALMDAVARGLVHGTGGGGAITFTTKPFEHRNSNHCHSIVGWLSVINRCVVVVH